MPRCLRASRRNYAKAPSAENKAWEFRGLSTVGRLSGALLEICSGARLNSLALVSGKGIIAVYIRLTEGNPMPRVEFTRLMQLALPAYELNSAIYTRLASALQLILTRNFEENSALDIHNYETEFLNAPPEDWAYFFSLAHPFWSGAGSALLATTTTGPAFLRSRIAHRGGGNWARGFRRRPRPHPSKHAVCSGVPSTPDTLQLFTCHNFNCLTVHDIHNYEVEFRNSPRAVQRWGGYIWGITGFPYIRNTN
ncbi:hypothetical protein GGR50DRAFT_691874 [Xylaria sp. CBS 124048]|nr:hypothetical protein GGR50DRAFT_691874 [Xylaria sp. CBS 124048]